MTLEEALTFVNRLSPRDKVRLIDELTHQLLAEGAVRQPRPVPATGADLRGVLAPLKLKVEAGRITGEAPPGMPDGDVDVCLAEPDDDMSEDELERLNGVLEAGWRSLQAGRVRSATEVVAALRARR